MRDLQSLENLSTTAALGLWADDVVLALHRAVTGTAVGERDKRILSHAASTLAATRTRADEPLAPAGTARDLAASDTALSVVASLAQEQAGGAEDQTEEIGVFLSAMADVLTDAADGKLAGASEEQLQPALRFFGTVGEVQLMESNSVLAARKDLGAWMATRTISSYS
jgi:hypothetical protein